MFRFIIILIILLVFCGCEKGTELSNEDGFSGLIICHSIGNGEFEKMKIPSQDLDLHLNHGDGFTMRCHPPTFMFMGKDCKLYEVYHRNRCEQ
jgi:hypothetical protein